MIRGKIQGLLGYLSSYVSRMVWRPSLALFDHAVAFSSSWWCQGLCPLVPYKLLDKGSSCLVMLSSSLSTWSRQSLKGDADSASCKYLLMFAALLAGASCCVTLSCTVCGTGTRMQMILVHVLAPRGFSESQDITGRGSPDHRALNSISFLDTWTSKAYHAVPYARHQEARALFLIGARL